MHHPFYTYGPHNGKFNLNKHIFPFKNKIPLPILGSLALQIRSTGGVTTQDISNTRYNKLKRRLVTMLNNYDKVILVSGHEHSMQLLDNKELFQIVVGSGAKVSPVSLGAESLFACPKQGFAVLDIYEDGASNIRFYDCENNAPTLAYQSKLFESQKSFEYEYPKEINNTITSSIYTQDEVNKSKIFKWLWGDHYRNLYAQKIQVPVTTLDTLLGGLTIQRQGGGQVTRSLRLTDSIGKEYGLKAMKKSVTQFLQKGAFKNTYLADNFKNTFTEDILKRFLYFQLPLCFFDCCYHG